MSRLSSVHLPLQREEADDHRPDPNSLATSLTGAYLSDSDTKQTSISTLNMTVFWCKADISDLVAMRSPDVRLWHLADMLFVLANVRFWVESGHDSRIAKCLLMTRN